MICATLAATCMPAAAAACANTLTLPGNAQWTDPACGNATGATPLGGSCTAVCSPGYVQSGGYERVCSPGEGAVGWAPRNDTLACARESLSEVIVGLRLRLMSEVYGSDILDET
jgi:hypothetical protein